MKLNLGSGPSGTNSWVNYDWGVLPVLSKVPLVRRLLVALRLLPATYDLKWPKIQLVDIRGGLPLDDGTVEYLYCSHVLEHFERWEVEFILKESYRVLKNGGIARIVLPDLDKIISGYKSADDFCRKFYGYDKALKSWTKFFIRGHQWMYDQTSFRDLLLKAGFKKIEFTKIKVGKVPEIDVLDLALHEELSFYVEATKN